ncbi:BLUF domain-containing protein [Sphingomonas sp. BN140010]|uniref:BLUF domain-containing protein n=1 Tax=Sphingomonas arvum TaxID=2992113 RepID=A0ABT3JEE7_9SPHN|nr:BLUF domain-containing protein [Sphingomonas sp. BN140010]MCW3797384.1 BLUF domain-containing protein [Sphingomonas sp. BN140010]
MEQIIYISTSRAPVRPTDEELQHILSVSRRNNARDGLSGLLVVGGRRFLQVLEGPSEALNRAFNRIRGDERHFAVVELTRRAIEQRSFPEWDMGFEVQGKHLTEVVGKLIADVEDPLLRAQVDGFAKIHSKAA